MDHPVSSVVTERGSRRFTRRERLKRRDEISAVFRRGKKVSCSGAKLFFMDNGKEANRIVFAFPRKYGTAVARNRSRRLSRESYRLMKDGLRDGYDLALLVFPGADEFEGRKRQLRTLFSKAGLMAGRP